jgi:hypothetical protein
VAVDLCYSVLSLYGGHISISQWGFVLHLGLIVCSRFSLGPWANFLGQWGTDLLPWEVNCSRVCFYL